VLYEKFIEQKSEETQKKVLYEEFIEQEK